MSGNLYQRGSVFWFRATVHGIEHRHSLRCRDRKTAVRLAAKRIEELNLAAYHGEARHTWEEAVTAWADHSFGQISPSTAKRYAVSLKQVQPYLTGMDITAIDGKTIQSMITARRQTGATPATVRRDLTAISRVLEYAEALGWREGNPTLSKRRLLKERRDPICLPERGAIKLMISQSSGRFGALIQAALLTGCRQDELCRLTWRSFNAPSMALDIIGKGNKRRTIQLSEEAAAHLAAQPRTLGSELIFCKEDGTAFRQAASDFCHIKRAVRREHGDFHDFRFHDLRHLFAVCALRDGMGIYALSKHLGHTSVFTTEKHYLAFLTPEEAEKAKDKAA